MAFQIKHALPHLENGAFFVLEPVFAKTVTNKVRTYRMRMKYPDMNTLDGSWGHPKKLLDRLGKLEKFMVNGNQAWRLKKGSGDAQAPRKGDTHDK